MHAATSSAYNIYEAYDVGIYVPRYLPPTGTRMYVELPARTYKGVFSRYIYYCSLNKRWTRVRVIYYIRSQPFLFFRNWGVYVADEAAAQL